MIIVTRPDNTRIAINQDAIERVEETPTTVIRLHNGNSYTVRETLDEVIEIVIAYRTRVHGVIAVGPAQPVPPRPSGAAILASVAGVIKGIPNRIAIEGHTDDVPISTAQFRSNWELSTARATDVLRYLVDTLGLPVNRVSAAGYGDQRPLAGNDTAAGRARNRRVELAVLSGTPTS